jgi:hypothetical protein
MLLAVQQIPCDTLRVQVLGAVPTKQEVTGDWRKLPNEELCDVYSSLIITVIQVVKSKRIRWAGHVLQKREIYSQFLWGNMKEKDHLEDLGINGRITSNQI